MRARPRAKRGDRRTPSTARHASPRSKGPGSSTVEHEVVAWQASWDTEGIRALYATFSPICATRGASGRPRFSTASSASRSTTSVVASSARSSRRSTPHDARLERTTATSASTSYNPIVDSRTMLPIHAAPTCSVAGAAEIVGSKWTVLIVHDLSEGPAAVHPARAVMRRDQPADARRATALARVRGDGRPPELSGVAAPRRVRADGEGGALLPVVHEMRRFGHEWLGCGVHDTAPADELREPGALVSEARGAQLLERALGLLEAREPHPLEDPRRLRELDVAVVDDLPRFPHGSRKSWLPTISAPASRARPTVSVVVVDDEPDVAGRRRARAHPTRGRRTGRPCPRTPCSRRVRGAGTSSKMRLEEGDHLVDVADLDREVVDPDESQASGLRLVNPERS